MNPRFVKLIDHEPHDAVVMFGHHADAISLPQTADEIVFQPREFETISLDRQHFGHVSTNHPTDMNPNF
jgi:hypothetical protein